MRWRASIRSLIFGGAALVIQTALVPQTAWAQTPPAATPPATTPAPDWQAANREVISLVRAGRYAEAEARAQTAQTLCPQDAALRVMCLTLLQENTAWAQASASA